MGRLRNEVKMALAIAILRAKETQSMIYLDDAMLRAFESRALRHAHGMLLAEVLQAKGLKFGWARRMYKVVPQSALLDVGMVRQFDPATSVVDKFYVNRSAMLERVLADSGARLSMGDIVALAYVDKVDATVRMHSPALELTRPGSGRVGLTAHAFRSLENLVTAVVHGAIHAAGERHLAGLEFDRIGGFVHDLLHERHINLPRNGIRP